MRSPYPPIPPLWPLRAGRLGSGVVCGVRSFGLAGGTVFGSHNTGSRNSDNVRLKIRDFLAPTLRNSEANKTGPNFDALFKITHVTLPPNSRISLISAILQLGLEEKHRHLLVIQNL